MTFGPSEDVPGKCNARLFLGDDYGDGTCTMRCGLPEGHEGEHQEDFGRGTVTWKKDERFNCPKHGLQSQSCCEPCSDEESEWWQATCEHGMIRQDCAACLDKEYDGTEHTDS